MDYKEAVNNFKIDISNDFLRESQKHDGGESNKKNYPLPSWINLELIKEGQRFVERNFFSVFFAHFISLIFLLCYEPVRVVLVKTSKSDSKLKALKRYLSTLIHVKRWYEGNLLELHENAAQDVYRVRKIHAGVSRQLKYKKEKKKQQPKNDIPENDFKIIEAIKKDLNFSYSNNNNNNSNGDTYLIDETERTSVITQLDMAVTQFCFMGFIFLYPAKFGIAINNGSNTDYEQQRKESKELEGFVHLWAIIGHLLGIEDRFNICLDRNAKIRETILSNVLLVDLMKCHADSVKLWQSLATGISEVIPCISLRAVLLFALKNLLECTSSENINSLLTFYERFCFKMMTWCFNSWIKLNIMRTILNALLRLAIFLSERYYFPSSKSTIPVIFHI